MKTLPSGPDEISPPPPQSTGPLTAPAHLSAAPGDAAGQIVLRWHPVKNAAGYRIQQSFGSHGPGAWHPAGVSSTASFKATALNRNSRYWFRVSACGATGSGAWSRATTQIAF
jgi:hypothetical protein